MSPVGHAIIEIHDWKGADRKWPRAIVIRSDRSRDEIDILASVRQDAASVGHPAILCAIKRWEEIIICQSAFSTTAEMAVSYDNGEYLPEESDTERAERRISGLSRAAYDRICLERAHREFHERTGPHVNFARIARGHLKNLSISVIDGAQSRAWSKEQAFDVYRHKVFTASYSYLELAFKVWCGSREPGVSKLMTMVIERFRNYGFGDERLGSPLSEEAIERLRVGFDDIRAFLKSRPGKRALHGRRDWKIWRRAFDAWRFPTLSPHTQEVYLQKSKSQPMSIEVRRASLTPKWNWYQLSDMSVGFDLPTIQPRR
jgi:hypothetical protein